MKRLFTFLFLATCAAGMPQTSAAGQASSLPIQPADQAGGNIAAPWLPFMGCWRPSDERAPEQGVLVCVVPAGANAARMMTMAGDQPVIDETFVADGAAHAVAEPGCRGTRTSDWSKSGRLLAKAELTCDGQPTRSVSGLSFIAAGGDWVDIQAVTTGNREIVRVRRYRRTNERPPDESLLPPEVATRAAQSFGVARLTAFTMDDVIEASGKVSAGAIEAAIVETQSTFPLNRRTLIALGDAGVAGNVIDLMVAQTFPQQFQVTRRVGSSSASYYPGYGGLAWDGYGYDPFYTFYSPFGYRYWTQYGNYDYYSAGTGVIIVPAPGGGTAPSSEHGRVVNGGGYTQVSRSGPALDGSSRSSDSGGSSSSADPGSSGGVSSGGYSSSGGGGGDDGVRTAVPR